MSDSSPTGRIGSSTYSRTACWRIAGVIVTVRSLPVGTPNSPTPPDSQVVNPTTASETTVKTAAATTTSRASWRPKVRPPRVGNTQRQSAYVTKAKTLLASTNVIGAFHEGQNTAWSRPRWSPVATPVPNTSMSIWFRRVDGAMFSIGRGAMNWV